MSEQRIDPNYARTPNKGDIEAYGAMSWQDARPTLQKVKTGPRRREFAKLSPSADGRVRSSEER